VIGQSLWRYLKNRTEFYLLRSSRKSHK